MRAVASVPSIGFVAVGEDLKGDTGIVWVSKDGRTWSRAPADPSFGRVGIQVRMYAVTAGPTGVVVAGTLDAGVQYGEAAIWTSSDGLAWKRVAGRPGVPGQRGQRGDRAGTTRSSRSAIAARRMPTRRPPG